MQVLEEQTKTKVFPIVGIGSSAGGFESLKELFSQMPADPGMSFVIIQHMAAQQESLLSELISRLTKLKVVNITNEQEVEENTIYVTMPDSLVEIRGGSLYIKSLKGERSFAQIDHFFKSLAREYKQSAIGLLLSGTGHDGTAGISLIKSEGGITLAADVSSVRFGGMSSSAIDTGDVDFIGSSEEIAKELLRIKDHPYLLSEDLSKQESFVAEKDGELIQIFKILKKFKGVDFTHYKSSTIKRRLLRRMVLNRIENLADYLSYLKKHTEEVSHLYDDLLINVTSFFRDKEVFDNLTQTVFPRLVRERKYNDPIRIWIPGCSSGEEVYSIAIVLGEYLTKHKINLPIQIFATDISEQSIEKARKGIYLESIADDVPPELLRKYFTRLNDGGYQINKNIRDLCLYAKHDITKDPPFLRIDLLSCRNLLIYLSPLLQKKVIPVFHYALKPQGILLLGSSESVGEFASLFKLTDKKHKLFEKKESALKYNFDFSYTAAGGDKMREQKGGGSFIGEDVQKEADGLILEKYSLPSILINENLEIIQFRGKIAPYIQPSSGMASLYLFKMIKEGISLDLHSVIRRAKQEKKSVSGKVRFIEEGELKTVSFEVVPLKRDSTVNYYLILFKSKDEIKAPDAEGISAPDAEGVQASDEDLQQIDIIRKELLATREHLQTIIEERDITNEELRSAIEEIQSSNEELQSTNEELETAKEELQSTNEELISVNDELENRNGELTLVNNDLTNLLVNVNIPIIMLGNDYRIRRFTQKAEKVWNLIATDVGRPFSDLRPNIEVPRIQQMIEEVLDTLETQEIEIEDKENNWYWMRIRPYKTIENKIDGVVITLIEMGEIKKLLNEEMKARNFSETIMDAIEVPILIIDKGIIVRYANKSLMEIFELNGDTLKGKFLTELKRGEVFKPSMLPMLEDFMQSDETEKIFEIKKNEYTAEIKKLKTEEDYFILTFRKI